MAEIHAVSFTGHRPQGLTMLNETAKRQLRPLLRREILQAVARGCHRFYSGMAMGVDLLAAEEVMKLKATIPQLQLIAVLPFATQASGFPLDWRTRYERALQQADEVVQISEGYHPGCYKARNRYLVEQCNLLVAVYNGNEKSGTGQTVRMGRTADKELHLYEPNESGNWTSRIETVEIQYRFDDC